LKLESDKYCETKLFSKMDKYYETEGVYGSTVSVKPRNLVYKLYKKFRIRATPQSLYSVI